MKTVIRRCLRCAVLSSVKEASVTFVWSGSEMQECSGEGWIISWNRVSRISLTTIIGSESSFFISRLKIWRLQVLFHGYRKILKRSSIGFYAGIFSGYLNQVGVYSWYSTVVEFTASETLKFHGTEGRLRSLNFMSIGLWSIGEWIFWIQIWRQDFSGWLSFEDDLLCGLSQCSRLDSSESSSWQIGGLLVKASTVVRQRL